MRETLTLKVAALFSDCDVTATQACGQDELGAEVFG